jgi:hypothetical protein
VQVFLHVHIYDRCMISTKESKTSFIFIEVTNTLADLCCLNSVFLVFKCLL